MYASKRLTSAFAGTLAPRVRVENGGTQVHRTRLQVIGDLVERAFVA